MIMMQHTQFFLAICAVTFLSIPVVEGFFWRDIWNRLLFTDARNERDCEALLRSAGIDRSENDCSCTFRANTLKTTKCAMNEYVCLAPSNPFYCTNSSVVSMFGAKRQAILGLFNPTRSEAMEVEYYRDYPTTDDLDRIFARFAFYRNYTGSPFYECYASFEDDGFFRDPCQCEICASGLDFKYDCSNVVNGGPFRINQTTEVFVPGPKVDTCIPVTDILPSF